MTCPKCGDINAYESLFRGWSCTTSDCVHYDPSIAITVATKQKEKENIDGSVWSSERRIYQDNCLEDFQIWVHPSKEVALRWVADFILDSLSGYSIDEASSILEDILDQDYESALIKFNREVPDEHWEINCQVFPTEYSDEHLSDRAQELLDQLS